MIRRQILKRRVCSSAVSCAMFFASGIAAAATPGPAVDLGALPPDLTAGAAPNVYFTLDDSGSMGFDFVPDIGGARGGMNLYNLASYSSSVNTLFYDPSVTYLPPVDASGTPFPNSSYTNAWIDGICANYTGPNTTGSGLGCGLGLSNPKATINLSTGFNMTAAVPYWPAWVPPPPLPATTPPPNNYPIDYGCNPLGLSIGCGAYYTTYNPTSTCPAAPSLSAAASCWAVVPMNSASAAQQQNFANWYSYYRTRGQALRTVISRAFAQVSDRVRLTWALLDHDPDAKSASFGSTTRPIEPLSNVTSSGTTWRKAFYDWLLNTPSPFLGSTVVSNTPLKAASIAAGEYFRATRNPHSDQFNDPYWNEQYGSAAADLSCRANFHLIVTDGYWDEPNKQQFRSDPNLLKPSIAGTGTFRSLPDGTAYAQAPESTVMWDVTSGGTPMLIAPAENGGPPNGCKKNGDSDCFPTLADVAFYYWATDLQPSLKDNVPASFPDLTTGVTAAAPLSGSPASNAEIYWNPANDPASWQHMSTMIVSIGVTNGGGGVTFPTDLTGLRTGALSWPLPRQGMNSAAADSWHAALASRGVYAPASNPMAVADGLNAAFNTIMARSSAGSATVATNAVLTANTTGFTAGYSTSSWAGNLIAAPLDANGQPGAPRWDAGCILTGGTCATAPQASSTPPRDPTSRFIVTSHIDGTAAKFEWSDLDSTETAVLDGADGKGRQRLDYLRGDRSNETSPLSFRPRTSVLGAIIDSQPVYVSAPSGGFSDDWPTGAPEGAAANLYSKFVYANRARKPAVYVGANDGMLHAFDASTGAELWAYVPHALFENGKLPNLVNNKSIGFTTVDDTPVVQDVFINGSWHTVLIETMRLGARGVFALDITDPTSLNENAAKSRLLWEVTNKSGTQYQDLGYTYGSANIARIHALPGWVALVTSGYFPKSPKETDPAASVDQTSLFVLDLATGAVIKEIKTPPGTVSFGLSTPAVYDANGDQVDDYAVAGDLAGNLWRFDLSSSDPNTWSAQLMFTTYTDPTGIGQNPISVMPVALRDTTMNVPIWVFGSGKYLGPEDVATNGWNFFYGVRDFGPGSTTLTPNNLIGQTLTESATSTGTKVLTISNYPIDSSHGGWDIQMPNRGERDVVTATPLYTSNNVVLSTILPNNDPCSPGHAGSVLVLDAADASPPAGGVSSNGTSLPPNAVGVALDSTQLLPVSGMLPTLTPIGGGVVKVPGLIDVHDVLWHRSSWRNLRN